VHYPAASSGQVATVPWSPAAEFDTTEVDEATFTRSPRRITFRVLLFVVLLGAVVYGGWWVVRWYVNNSYFVGIQRDHLVIYRGRIGGFVGIEPVIIRRSDVTTSEVLPMHLHDLRLGVEEPTLGAAERYIGNLRQEAASLQQTPGSSTTTTTVPAGKRTPPTALRRAHASGASIWWG
jgi:hypothetical protein